MRGDGSASPEQFSSLQRGSASHTSGAAAKNRERLTGKAEPFRTSGGRAAIKSRFQRYVQTVKL